MKIPRRKVLHLVAGTAAVSAVSRIAWAQAYPAKPVRFVVGVPPGGTLDIVARLVAQWLSERLGQQFVVENRPGAATNIGTDTVAHAPADGYTLLFAGSPAAINATLYDNLNFNFIRDIAPVGSVERMPLIMAVNPALPAVTVPQFVSYAKDNPGKVNLGSGGVGSTGHVSGEQFNMMAGIKIAHVPYRGEAPALTDLLGAQVQVVFATAGSAVQYVRAGTLRALAVSSDTRMDVLPDVPSIAEFLPGFEATSWTGVGAPRGTPVEIVDRLNREINAALGDDRFKAKLIDLGAAVLAGSPADFGKFIADETEKWGKVVRFSGAKAN